MDQCLQVPIWWLGVLFTPRAEMNTLGCFCFEKKTAGCFSLGTLSGMAVRNGATDIHPLDWGCSKDGNDKGVAERRRVTHCS